MWGHYSYLATIIIFAGSAILLEVLFGFQFIKKYLRVVGSVVLIFLIVTPVGETVAHLLRVWIYNPQTTLYLTFLGAEIETYLFSIFVGIAVSSAVILWTYYEDEGKPILLQSFRDMVKGTYAIWKKEK